jgi:ribosomal-protein-alanine N-acetyltransferase
MQTGDIPRVLQIAESLFHAPHWPVSAYETAINQESEPRRIALVAESPESDTPDSDAVAGFVVASLVAGEAELESIAVAADSQRHRCGGQLLVQLLAVLRELHVTRINLEVRASNQPALKLYRRQGFRETGRRVGYYADPVEDAVLMSLELG